MTATFHVGDAIEVMGKLPEKSVDLVLTSPPFLALRSYLPADHPDKALEGGSQATPGQYIDWLIDVVEACDRVLAPHGSLCIELGDTYSGTGGAGGDWSDSPLTTKARVSGGSNGGPTKRIQSDAWPLAKSLSLIPELFRLTLVYGTNPLTGRQTDRWRLRNVVRWVRPNPPVGALGDKFRPATSELMVFCKSAKRYFDLDSVRTPHQSDPTRFTGNGYEKGRPEGLGVGTVSEPGNPAGAPPLDWWNIPLLEGEEPTKGGPKGPKPWGPRHYYGSAEKGVGNQTKSTDQGEHRLIEGNPAGAPPLDWWEVSLLEGDEPKSYGPEEQERAKAFKEAQRPRKGDKSKVEGSFGSNAPDNPLGAPPLDWWNIPPGGYEGAHYAVFPPELCIKPIKAMCPEKVCRVCGEPSRPIREHLGRERYQRPPTPEEFASHFRAALAASGKTKEEVATQLRVTPRMIDFYLGQPTTAELPSLRRWEQLTEILNFPDDLVESMSVVTREYDTPDRGNRNVKERLSGGAINGDLPKVVQTGFTDCGHDDWRPGLVLDPFGGSGTTALVATGHGRDCILIDLDERNFELALQRVGPFILERAT